jgi:hypothetical protein
MLDSICRSLDFMDEREFDGFKHPTDGRVMAENCSSRHRRSPVILAIGSSLHPLQSSRIYKSLHISKKPDDESKLHCFGRYDTVLRAGMPDFDP